MSLAAGATSAASASFCPFSLSAGHPILPTKLNRQAEAGRPAELQWSKAAKPRPAVGEKHKLIFSFCFVYLQCSILLNMHNILNRQ